MKDLNLSRYFTTGEFAKVCNVKKQTLFHYDSIGILCPKITGSNGYRYYSYDQLETFNMISMLKELDMPLIQIKNYMDSRSPESFMTLLKEQTIEAHHKLDDILWLIKYLDTKTHITQAAMSAPLEKVITEEHEDQYYIITSYSGSDDERDIATAVSDHLNYCHSLDIYSAYDIGGMVPVRPIIDNSHYNYSHFYTRIDKREISSAHIKPAGSYVAFYDPHGYNNVLTTALKLIQYAKDSGYRTGTYIYEDAVLDSLSNKNYDKYTVKLSLQLIK